MRKKNINIYIALLHAHQHDNRRKFFFTVFPHMKAAKFWFSSNLSFMKRESERHFFFSLSTVCCDNNHTCTQTYHTRHTCPTLWYTKCITIFFFEMQFQKHIYRSFILITPFNASLTGWLAGWLWCVISIYSLKTQKIPYESSLNVLINYIWFDSQNATNWIICTKINMCFIFIFFSIWKATNFTWYLIKYANCRA